MILKKRKLIIPIISLIISFITTRIPLLHVFDYEFAVAFSFVNYFLSAVIGFEFFTKKFDRTDLIKQFIFITVLPPIISNINQLFGAVCSPWQGFGFYLIFTLPSIIIGYSVAQFSFFLSKKYCKIIFLFLSFLLLIIPAFEIYFVPQIYFYNSILTFFPGTIYDEDIAITSKIIEYKIFVLAYFTMILLLINKYGSKFRKTIIVFVFFTFIISLSLKSFYGFQSSYKSIEEHLGGKIITKNFIIIFPEEIDKEYLNYLVKLHEYEFENLQNEMQIKFSGKITSFIFRNKTEKKEIFGAGNADVSIPWRNEIYSEIENVERVIKHEIVHLFAAKFGTGVLKLAKNLNPSMIEGIAMAYENNYDDLSIDYLAYHILISKYNTSLETLFNGFNFFSFTSSLSYIYSGAFIKFLIENYGHKNIQRLYNTMDFNAIYKKDIIRLENEFISYLKSKNFSFNRATAQLYFGSKPLIKKICPRYAARELKSALQLKNLKRISDAKKIYLDLFEKTGNFSAFIGYLQILIEEKKFIEAESLIEKNINIFNKSSGFFLLRFLLADIKAKINKQSEALLIFKELLSNSISYSYDQIIKFRILYMKKNFTEAKKIIFDKKNQLNTLLKIFMQGNKSETIGLLLEANFDNNNIYKLVKSYFENEYQVVDVNSAETAYRASKLFIKKGDYLLAKKLAIQSLNYAANYKKEIYTAQLKRINWFMNFDQAYKN